MPNLPPGTKAILIANVAVFLLQLSGLDPFLFQYFALWSLGGSEFGAPSFFPWQLISYGFLHASLTHVAFNMLGLYMFGSQVEAVYGRDRFLVYYFVCVFAAGLTQLIVTSVMGINASTVGASGGVFGLMFAYARLFPHQTVMLIFPPIPMPAWLFVTLYGALELFYGVTGSGEGVAHFAHLGGILGGYLLIRYGRGLRR